MAKRVSFKNVLLCSIVMFQGWSISWAKGELPGIQEWGAGLERQPGFFPIYWDETQGKVWIEVPIDREEFLLVDYLSTGLGSNPIGLDRGRPGSSRLVRFHKVGPRLLLIESNQRFRALTTDPAEQAAVRESFAESVLWGGDLVAQTGNRVVVDGTGLMLRDAQDIVGTLKRAGQGTYRLDPSKSAVYLPRTRSFPLNTEFEVTLTFTSAEPGRMVSEMAPDPRAVSLRVHHSLVRLPNDDYQPRRFDPRMAANGMVFYDYASSLGDSLQRRYVVRHRLRKQDPSAAVSDPVEPIVYYVDPGAPEPIRTALMEGASWWNQAFEAAGFRDAFQVRVLPPDADPLDVRYNVIQWVHRSTRGWSYGSSIVDPRTGEILKGHVTLGSLRVRQDILIMDGLVAQARVTPNGADICQEVERTGFGYLARLDKNTEPVEVSLARIRQLAAHEVGHTLGFSHNFAASTFGRASVMDYPAPLVKVTDSGNLDLSEAYGVGIGDWDKVAVRFAYSDFPPGTNEGEALNEIIRESLSRDMIYVTDSDARPPGAAHPRASLWDNGNDPIKELEHVMEVRRIALNQLGEKSLLNGEPVSELRRALVPIYLFHRYQVEATAKLLGGVDYRYALKGDGQVAQAIVAPEVQRKALRALLRAIEAKELEIRDELWRLMPPEPPGYLGYGEMLPSSTAMVFDVESAAEIAADLVVTAVLQKERAARMIQFNRRDTRFPSFEEVLDSLLEATWLGPASPGREAQMVERTVQNLVLKHLLELASDQDVAIPVRATVESRLRRLMQLTESSEPGTDEARRVHRSWSHSRLQRFFSRSAEEQKPVFLAAPPGSPIGG